MHTHATPTHLQVQKRSQQALPSELGLQHTHQRPRSQHITDLAFDLGDARLVSEPEQGTDAIKVQPHVQGRDTFSCQLAFVEGCARTCCLR